MSSSEDTPCRLTVCRGCCCGTTKKVPGVDHDAQFARLSSIDDHTGRTVPVRRSDCLDLCSQANVVVVQPSARGRAAGGRPVWLGRVTDDDLVEALDDWIFEGGPGLALLPEVLKDHVTAQGSDKAGKKAKKKRTDRGGEPSEAELGKKRKKAEKKARKKAAEKRKKAEKKARKAAEAAHRADHG